MNRNRNVAYESDKKVLEIAKINVLNRIRSNITQHYLKCFCDKYKYYDDSFDMKYNKVKYTDYNLQINENLYEIDKLKIKFNEKDKCSISYYNENSDYIIDIYINKLNEFLKKIDNIEFKEDIKKDVAIQVDLYCVFIAKEEEEITVFEKLISDDDYDIYEQYIQEIQKFKTLIL